MKKAMVLNRPKKSFPQYQAEKRAEESTIHVAALRRAKRAIAKPKGGSPIPARDTHPNCTCAVTTASTKKKGAAV